MRCACGIGAALVLTLQRALAQFGAGDRSAQWALAEVDHSVQVRPSAPVPIHFVMLSTTNPPAARSAFRAAIQGGAEPPPPTGEVPQWQPPPPEVESKEHHRAWQSAVKQKPGTWTVVVEDAGGFTTALRTSGVPAKLKEGLRNHKNSPGSSGTIVNLATDCNGLTPALGYAVSPRVAALLLVLGPKDARSGRLVQQSLVEQGRAKHACVSLSSVDPKEEHASTAAQIDTSSQKRAAQHDGDNFPKAHSLQIEELQEQIKALQRARDAVASKPVESKPQFLYPGDDAYDQYPGSFPQDSETLTPHERFTYEHRASRIPAHDINAPVGALLFGSFHNSGVSVPIGIATVLTGLLSCGLCFVVYLLRKEVWVAHARSMLLGSAACPSSRESDSPEQMATGQWSKPRKKPPAQSVPPLKLGCGSRGHALDAS